MAPVPPSVRHYVQMVEALAGHVEGGSDAARLVAAEYLGCEPMGAGELETARVAVAVKAQRGRGRPQEGFSRSLDAAALSIALQQQGLRGRRAHDAIYTLFGISRSNVTKYEALHRVQGNALWPHVVGAVAALGVLGDGLDAAQRVLRPDAARALRAVVTTGN